MPCASVPLFVRPCVPFLIKLNTFKHLIIKWGKHTSSLESLRSAGWGFCTLLLPLSGSRNLYGAQFLFAPERSLGSRDGRSLIFLQSFRVLRRAQQRGPIPFPPTHSSSVFKAGRQTGSTGILIPPQTIRETCAH